MDLVSCFIHEIQRTAEPNNHQDYSANQSGIQNYRPPFYLRTLRRFLSIKKTESTCSGLDVIHQMLTPEPVTASLSVQLRCAAFPPLPADVSGGLPVGSA